MVYATTCRTCSSAAKYGVYFDYTLGEYRRVALQPREANNTTEAWCQPCADAEARTAQHALEEPAAPFDPEAYTGPFTLDR